jgi:hypothetical protein
LLFRSPFPFPFFRFILRLVQWHFVSSITVFISFFSYSFIHFVSFVLFIIIFIFYFFLFPVLRKPFPYIAVYFMCFLLYCPPFSVFQSLDAFLPFVIRGSSRSTVYAPGLWAGPTVCRGNVDLSLLKAMEGQIPLFCDVPFKHNKILKQRELLFLQHIKRWLRTHVSVTPSPPDMQLHVTPKLLSVFLTLRIAFVCLQVHSETKCSCTRCHFTFVFPFALWCGAGTKNSYCLLSPSRYFDLPAWCSECSALKFVCPFLPLGPFFKLFYPFYLEHPSYPFPYQKPMW